MTEQPAAFAETTTSSQHPVAAQKLEHLLMALNQLKSDISGVEARHPGLGNELSSLCAVAIADLNSLNSYDGAGQQAERDSPGITPGEQAATPEPIPTAKRAVNPLLSVIDKAGSYLITGLDKTGDGIIFVLEKLLIIR